MTLHHVRRGQGSPLLLVHGLGAGWRSWEPIIDDLAASREIIAVDLPGFGESPPLDGEVSIATLTDAVARFIDESGLHGVSTAGQSMGGRIVLELARRGVGGDTVALDPGGFWSDRELAIFSATLRPSIALVSALRWRSSPCAPGPCRRGPCCPTWRDWPTRLGRARRWTR